MPKLILSTLLLLLTSLAATAQSSNATGLTPTQLQVLGPILPQVARDLAICDETRKINTLLLEKVQVQEKETEAERAAHSQTRAELADARQDTAVKQKRLKFWRAAAVVEVVALVIGAALVL